MRVKIYPIGCGRSVEGIRLGRPQDEVGGRGGGPAVEGGTYGGHGQGARHRAWDLRSAPGPRGLAGWPVARGAYLGYHCHPFPSRAPRTARLRVARAVSLTSSLSRSGPGARTSALSQACFAGPVSASSPCPPPPFWPREPRPASSHTRARAELTQVLPPHILPIRHDAVRAQPGQRSRARSRLPERSTPDSSGDEGLLRAGEIRPG